MGAAVMDALVGPHPAIDRALAIAAEVYGEAVAGTASESLAQVLGDFAGQASGTAWQSSQLGRTGFPVEFALTTSGAPGLRYTSEVDALDPGGRLMRASDTFQRLSGNAVPDSVTQAATALQLDATLKYGAWVGCRHGRQGNSFKMYIEVPRGRTPGSVPAIRELEHRKLRVSMIGYQPDCMEVYYAIEDPRPGEIGTAMAPIGLESRAEEVLDLLAEARMRPIHREMPCTDFGFSYTMPVEGAPVFTLYAFANSLFGGDGRIRTALLRLAERRGWSLPFYEKLSEPLSETLGFITHHGLFGIVVPAVEPVGITVGLAPPQP
jgi:hypothetical protein